MASRSLAIPPRWVFLVRGGNCGDGVVKRLSDAKFVVACVSYAVTAKATISRVNIGHVEFVFVALLDYGQTAAGWL